MFGRFMIIEYATLASIISGCAYVISICITSFTTYKLGKNNNHSYANKIYKHMNYVISSYITLLLIIALVIIWAGYALSLLISIFAISFICLRYIYSKKSKDYLGILNIVKNNKCDVGDYISIDGINGKVVNFNMYYLELLDLNGAYAYVSGNKINNIINNSRNVFNVKVEVNISNKNNIDDVIKLLEKELPSLINDYPMILEGPNIDGASHVDVDYYTLSLSTKVKYEDIDKVKDAINAKVASLIGK